jgi:hypothetical protein
VKLLKTLNDTHLQAIITNDWSDKPRETWVWEARKVKPNKLFMVTGKNYLNTQKEKYETAIITTHKLSEAKKFAQHWEDKLAMTDIKIMETSLTWSEVDG